MSKGKVVSKDDIAWDVRYAAKSYEATHARRDTAGKAISNVQDVTIWE